MRALFMVLKVVSIFEPYSSMIINEKDTDKHFEDDIDA